MPSPELILFGLVLPAVLAGAVVLLTAWIFRNQSWPAILGLTVGVLLAYRGIASQWPPIRPIDSPERIVDFALALGIVAIFASFRGVPWPVRTILAIVAPALVVWFVFKPIPPASMPVEQMHRWIAVAAVIALAVTVFVEGLSHKRPGVAAAIVLGPMAAGVGAILLLVGTTKLGWLGASIGLMVLGWFFAGLIGKPITLSRGPVTVVVTLLTALITYDFFESGEITSMQIALLCGAPVLGWFVEIPPIKNMKAWKRELLRLVLVFIPIGIAVGLAVIQFKKDSAGNLEM
jgi:hypothetical protein